MFTSLQVKTLFTNFLLTFTGFYSSAPLMPNKPEAELTLEEELKHIEAARMEAEFEDMERRSREFFERLEKPPVRLVAAFSYAEGI